jgi:hypothetical protein
VGNLGVGLALNQDPYFERPLAHTGMTTAEKVDAVGSFVRRAVQPGFIGAAEQIAAARREGSTLQKRDMPQTVLRNTLGIDLRSADPTLRRMVDEYMVKRNLPMAAEQGGGDTTPRQRASRSLYDAILNEDQAQFDQAVGQLKRLGVPVRSFKQVKDVIEQREPLRRLKEDERPRFVRQLTPEQRRVVDDTKKEFRSLPGRALKLWGRRQGRESSASTSEPEASTP